MSELNHKEIRKGLIKKPVELPPEALIKKPVIISDKDSPLTRNRRVIKEVQDEGQK